MPKWLNADTMLLESMAERRTGSSPVFKKFSIKDRKKYIFIYSFYLFHYLYLKS